MYFVSKVAYLLESAATSWHRRRSSRAVGAGSLPVDFVVVRGGELQQFWVVDVAAEVAAGARRLGAAGSGAGFVAGSDDLVPPVLQQRMSRGVRRLDVRQRMSLMCDHSMSSAVTKLRRRSQRASLRFVTVWSSVVTVS
jgi:hypothetical protein